MNPADEIDPWSAGTFEGNRAAQAREAAALPAHERLRWACEMSELIRLRDLRAGRTPPALRPERYGPYPPGAGELSGLDVDGWSAPGGMGAVPSPRGNEPRVTSHVLRVTSRGLHVTSRGLHAPRSGT